MSTFVKNFSFLLITLVLLSLASQPTLATGANITITLRTLQQVKGELLVARKTILILSKVVGQSDEELSIHPEFIASIAKDDMLAIKVEGESRVEYGKKIGSIIGGIVGTTISSILWWGRESFGFWALLVVGGAVGEMGGYLLGSAIGQASSRSDVDKSVDNLEDLLSFSPYARYQEGEPEFLKKFVP